MNKCPNCGTNDINVMTTGKRIFLGICLIGFGIFLLLIPFIGVPIIILGLITIFTANQAKDQYKCNNCGYTWEKEEDSNES